MSTTQNLHRSQLIVIYVARNVHTACMFSWMLWGLSSFRAHYWHLTKSKVLGSAANASHRPLYQSGVVQNYSFLGVGVYFWSQITQIHTLAPSRILLYTLDHLVLQCLANACYKAESAWREWGVPRTFQFEIYILRAADALRCARLFCYQMICRISILNDSKSSKARWTSCITLTSRYKV